MIVQTSVVILTLTVAFIANVNGASFSNVYVESEVAPIGYYTYGTPYPSLPNPRLSQLNSLPAVPGYVGPCVSPCVYPAQSVATVAPVTPSQNVLTYTAPAPSAPVIVAPTKQEPTGYEYSYVVYDQNTGDHKAQRELSDGSVVRGQYSFLQPDGYIREVQYVADDISGFNAVVRNFLPVPEEGRKKSTANENKDSPPCHEIKSESLKEGSDENSGEISIKKVLKIHEKLHKKQSSEESAEKSEEHSGKSKESEEEEISHEKNNKVNKKASNEESREESKTESSENLSKKPKNSKETSEEKSKEIPKPKHSKEESKENSEEENHNKSIESTGKSNERQHKKTQKVSEDSEESGEESESEESKEELKEEIRKKASKDTEASKNKSKKGSKEMSGEHSSEESVEVSSGKHKEVQELLTPSTEAVIPYKDIIRCIEAAMKRNYGVAAAMRQEQSPLTYIVLNKPC